MELSDVHAELVALLEHALAALLDEGVEFRRELGHAVAQLVEAKVDVGEAVGHRGADGRAPAGGVRGFEDGCHGCYLGLLAIVLCSPQSEAMAVVVC